MSETKNTQENETERDASENKTEKDAPIYFLSDPFTNKQLQYEFILFLILSHNIDPLDQEALAEILHRVKGDFDKDIIRQAVIDAQMKAKEDAHNKLTKKLTPEKYDQIAKKWSEAIKKTFDEMSGTRSTQENETDQKLPIDEEGEAIQGNFQIKSFREKEDISNLDVERAMNAGKEEWDAVVKQVKGLQFTIIPLLIDEEPLTPQTLALAFSALTELTTKLWLIAQHRFADLIEYTQTHDVRFANEAGSTIAYVTYNSPFNFGL
jgi:hypothetical protein